MKLIISLVILSNQIVVQFKKNIFQCDFARVNRDTPGDKDHILFTAYCLTLDCIITILDIYICVGKTYNLSLKGNFMLACCLLLQIYFESVRAINVVLYHF